MKVRFYLKKDIERIDEIGLLLTNFSFKLDVFSHCLVIEDNDYVVGFLIYSIAYEKAEILYIAVDEKYQNKGYAKKLMEEVINICKNCYNITLEVNTNNIKAINLYKGFKFEIVSTRKKYYNNDDAYLMERLI